MTKKILGVWSAIILAILAVVVLPQSVRAEGSDPPPNFDTDAHGDSIDALLQQGACSIVCVSVFLFERIDA